MPPVPISTSQYLCTYNIQATTMGRWPFNGASLGIVTGRTDSIPMPQGMC